MNRIVADVGGRSGTDDEWDWITQANRFPLGSSLKPVLDLCFLLKGYNLNDILKIVKLPIRHILWSRESYIKIIYINIPTGKKVIADIEKNWSWSPKNYRTYTDMWVSIKDALVKSVNSIMYRYMEIVTSGVFSRFLNEVMNIVDKDSTHKPYRSIILGGSCGDQRYDKFLLAYSIFANQGIVKKHTYFEALRLPCGSILWPDYQPIKITLIERHGKEKVMAACLLINLAMREIVKHGTMHAMGGIGAGKTGTSNELRDALATIHFISNGDTI